MMHNILIIISMFILIRIAIEIIANCIKINDQENVKQICRERKHKEQFEDKFIP